ncbi:hypothetical protein Pmar_PMAR018529, partial [Perkinsus marinus ATCC 50983]
YKTSHTSKANGLKKPEQHSNRSFTFRCHRATRHRECSGVTARSAVARAPR